MNLMETLENRWINKTYPAIVIDGLQISFKQIKNTPSSHLKNISRGDVVAIIGDFDVQSIANLINLIDIGAIIVPLSPLTSEDHEYFFDTARVKWVVENVNTILLPHALTNELLEGFKGGTNSGLILFSSGTTGRPKAILHDLTLFMNRFYTLRPTMRTLAFLLFDHIGGINTLFHALFNSSTVVCTKSRDIDSILKLCEDFNVELLPTTPTFLRLMLFSGAVPTKIPKSLKVITYGTERMDEATLKAFCDLLPHIDFRQTYGLSELGILRIKSKSRDSLFMKIGGEGVEWKVENSLLYLRSKSRMIGYLNSDSPFDNEGWYLTNDLVEVQDDYIKIIGRNNDVVNVGGLKFLLTDVERVAYANPEIELAKVVSKQNPITGQHIEIFIQLREESRLDLKDLKAYFSKSLPTHMIPRKFEITNIEVGHRHKKL